MSVYLSFSTIMVIIALIVGFSYGSSFIFRIVKFLFPFGMGGNGGLLIRDSQQNPNEVKKSSSGFSNLLFVILLIVGFNFFNFIDETQGHNPPKTDMVNKSPEQSETWWDKFESWYQSNTTNKSKVESKIYKSEIGTEDNLQKNSNEPDNSFHLDDDGIPLIEKLRGKEEHKIIEEVHTNVSLHNEYNEETENLTPNYSEPQNERVFIQNFFCKFI